MSIAKRRRNQFNGARTEITIEKKEVIFSGRKSDSTRLQIKIVALSLWKYFKVMTYKNFVKSNTFNNNDSLFAKTVFCVPFLKLLFSLILCFCFRRVYLSAFFAAASQILICSVCGLKFQISVSCDYVVWSQMAYISNRTQIF